MPIATTSWPTCSSPASPRRAGDEVARVGAQDREVGERVAPDDREAQVAAVDERRLAGARALDDVGRGEQVAVRGDDDGAAAAHRGAPAAHPAADAQVRDARGEVPRDGRDDARVGVERLGVGGSIGAGRAGAVAVVSGARRRLDEQNA